jgi:hypothetical protein
MLKTNFYNLVVEKRKGVMGSSLCRMAVPPRISAKTLKDEKRRECLVTGNTYSLYRLALGGILSPMLCSLLEGKLGTFPSI